MDKIKIDSDFLNDITRIVFLDTACNYYVDKESENFPFDMKSIEHLNFDSILSVFGYSVKESNKYWDANPKTTGAFDVIKRNTYEIGGIAAPAHHINVSRFLLNEKEQIFSMFGKFDCSSPVFKDGSYVYRNENESLYFKTHMKWTGVSGVCVKKRVFNYKTLEEVESKIVPWVAIENYVARCYHSYVGLREICDFNGRAVLVLDVGYHNKTGTYTFYEISFDYTGGQTENVEIAPYNFQHWSFCYNSLKEKNKSNQKFKKRKHKAKRKFLSMNDFY